MNSKKIIPFLLLLVIFSCTSNEIIESPIDKSIIEIERLLQTEGSNPQLIVQVEKIIYANGIRGQLDPRLFHLVKQIAETRNSKPSMASRVMDSPCTGTIVGTHIVNNGNGSWCYIYYYEIGSAYTSCHYPNGVVTGACDPGFG